MIRSPFLKPGALLVAALLLTACNEAEDPVVASPADPATAEAELVSGVDTTGMNTAVRPQDDFYEYANGAWLASTEIPADEIGWGSYMTLSKRSLEQSRAILDELLAGSASGPEAEKLADFYRAWMDEERVAELGIAPLADDLAAIAALEDHAAVATYLGEMNPAGVDGPFNFYVGQDAKDSTRYVVNFGQSGLGLPDRDYYFDDSERGQVILAAYRKYLETLMTLAGMEDPAAAVERTLALETALAEQQWDKVKTRDRELTYNPYEHDAFMELLDSFAGTGYMQGIGVEPQPFYNVRQPSYFAAVNALFGATDLQSWQDYLRARLLSAYAAYLSPAFVDARFAFVQTVYGREEQTPRWRRAVNSVNGQVGEMLGRLYVERYFSPESKARMEVMVAYLLEAYADSIRNLDWMSDATKEKALLKLSKFTPKIAYPDEWKDYSALRVAADDLVGNIKRARTFSHNDNVDQLGQPIDRKEWFLPPQTVNAYFNPGLNEIVFPAAYLQPPNFLPDAEDAYNYGAIGSTIGHEIGHGFDDQGSKYDGDGNLVSWWTAADREEFDARSRVLVDQFSAFEVQPGLRVNGELTLGENIGDLGGVAIALKAYRMSLEGREAPVIDGFSAEERFFLGNAQSSRIKWREQFIEMLVKTDPHSPDKYRVNGIFPNVADFNAAYDLKPGDGLYIAPEARVSIWE